jgi:hypothetical protein
MASKVDVWNLALSNIGHKAQIADPDERSAEANHCRRFYPMALGVTLERFAWGFATRRAILAQVDNPVDHWMFAYALPNLCIAPRAVLLPESTDDSQEQDFEIESVEGGDVILYTNVEDAVLKYTTQVDDTTKYSPLFVMAVAADLAAMLVGPIPKDPRKRQEMQQLAVYYTGQAQASNANGSRSSTYMDFTPSHLSAR